MFRIVIGKNTEAVFIFYGRFLVQAAALNSVNEAVEIYITKGGHKKGLHSTGFFGYSILLMVVSQETILKE